MSAVECTHVLVFVPGYLAKPPQADGWWDLVTLAEFKSGNFPDRNPDSVDWLRDTGSTAWGFRALHRFVAERLGWRVSLEERTQVIAKRRWSRGHREPVYYVWTVAS